MTDSTLRVVDLDLRLVGYFVAVAEHRHFGRAAAALRIAQPSLSRQIRRLEQQIGVRLFDRTPQSTRLTEAGEVFLPRAEALLRSAAQATAQARDAAQPGRITIGYTTSMIITPAVRALRREGYEVEVTAEGRGAASRPRRARTWLGGPLSPLEEALGSPPATPARRSPRSTPTSRPRCRNAPSRPSSTWPAAPGP